MRRQKSIRRQKSKRKSRKVGNVGKVGKVKKSRKSKKSMVQIDGSKNGLTWSRLIPNLSKIAQKS